jgi:F0F1-type ATP synthase alpha subunit
MSLLATTLMLLSLTFVQHRWHARALMHMEGESNKLLLPQVVDEQQGPTTKREYDVAKVPVGEELAREVVDFLGRAPGTQVQLGTSAFAPLLAEQPDMESREQIAEALVTGVKVRLLRLPRIS